MKQLCLLFLIFFLKISAQTEIKGIIFSDNNSPVNRANIILLNTQNEIETFGFSDKIADEKIAAGDREFLTIF